MPRFSANLGFLWTELSLPNAIRRAAEVGFDAVECHFPYEIDPAEVKAALDETGLPMLGINTRLGKNGRMILACLLALTDGRRLRGYIDEALSYAVAVGAGNINAVAGKTGRG